MKRLLSLIGGVVLSLSVSPAAIIVNYVSQSGAGAGPNGGTVYTYDIDIASDTTARAGDYFVIYDFGQLLSFSSSDANWTLGFTDPTGPYPPAQLPNDSPAIPNVQIVYNGPNLAGPAFTGSTDLEISLESPYSLLTDGTLNVSSRFLDNTGGIGSGGDTRDLPVPDAGVPEPGTMGLLGASLFGIGLFTRRRLK
jgi:hypothetical protein